MTKTSGKETWRPDERPDEPPTHPYDPFNPDEQRGPIPVPPDKTPVLIPGREPSDEVPVGDPPASDPIRIAS